jgi:uncharacterized protein (DUF58 family)
MALLTPEFMARLDTLQVGMRKVLAGRFRGERRSRRRGRSVEFADHREYAYGDDIRFLDWHLFARMDRLFLKLFHDEEELRVHLILDGSASMDFGDPTKFQQARRVAAAIAYVALSSMNRVKVVVLEENGLSELPWQRGPQAAGRLFGFLEAAEPKGRNALGPGLRRFAAEGRPSGVVVLLSDLLDRGGAVHPVKALVRPSVDAHIIQILTPEELEPELVGDFRLLDSEEADAVDVAGTTGVLRAYQRNLAAYLKELQDFARSRGLGYLLTRTDTPFEDLVLTHLREKGILR